MPRQRTYVLFNDLGFDAWVAWFARERLNLTENDWRTALASVPDDAWPRVFQAVLLPLNEQEAALVARAPASPRHPNYARYDRRIRVVHTKHRLCVEEDARRRAKE